VRKSLIKNAGWGLFATKDLKRSAIKKKDTFKKEGKKIPESIICSYEGVHVLKATLDKEKEKEIMFEVRSRINKKQIK
jgi:hypothetical protein